MKGTYIRFENGQEDRIGKDLGPFEWVQITYSIIRTDQDGDDLAFQNEDDFWILVDEPEQLWSDVIIYCKGD